METRGESIRVVHPLFQEEGGGSIPTSPLQFNIGIIHWRIAEQLNGLWHSRMPRVAKPETHNPCFGAEYNGVFFAIAMWGYPLAANRLTNGEKMLELKRMAIAQDAPKNTASRMIAVMTRAIKRLRPDLIKLISYQDTEVHSGTIYKASGWAPVVCGKFQEWKRDYTGVGFKYGDTYLQSRAQKIRWELDLSPNAKVRGD